MRSGAAAAASAERIAVLIDIALPNIDDTHLPPFVIARLAQPRCCPVLGAPLQQAISHDLVAGMDVVLVHRDAAADLRTYGNEVLVNALTGINVDDQHWVRFELRDDAGAGSSGVEMAA